MKKSWIIGVLCLINVSLSADDWGIAHENVLCIRGGFAWQQDQYLSPLLYSGHQVGISNEWWQRFLPPQRKYSYNGRYSNYDHELLNDLLIDGWKHIGKINANFGWSYSNTHTSLIQSLGISGGWGACYSWIWRIPKIELLVGPYLDVDWMNKKHSMNVNKPYSTDLAVNLCGMVGAGLGFEAGRTSYRIRYLAQINLMGVEYTPDYWQSYYEMIEGVWGIIRFSGPWNHLHLRHELTFDMQFKHSTWRIGATHEYLEYGTEIMMFSREQVSAIIGCIWHYKVKTAESIAIW